MITFHAINAQGAAEGFSGVLTPAALHACAAAAVNARGRKYRKPWVDYLVTAQGVAVGTCGFVAAPEEGRVNVTCETFGGYEGKGFGTAMMRALVRIAGTVRPGVVIVAQTPPQEDVAGRVLEKAGFEYIGMVDHADRGLLWEWHARTAGTA